MKNRSGFTLIELTIVMTILVIMGTAAFSAFRTTRMNARDVKRRGDLVALQQAFEQYFAINGAYNSTSCLGMADSIRGGYPTDPLGLPDWVEYVESCSSLDAYCVCAHLERTDTGNSEDSACAFDDPTTTNPFDWFCVENQQ